MKGEKHFAQMPSCDDALGSTVSDDWKTDVSSFFAGE